MKDTEREFTLTEEHIKLAAHLRFEVQADSWYGDAFIPAINPKRPFGNSGTSESALEILGCQVGEDGYYKKEDLSHAEDLLIGLPAAMEIILARKTFEPGTYEMERYGAYNCYERMRNYKALKGAIKEAEETLCAGETGERQLEQLRSLCMNVHGSDPWKVIKDLQWAAGSGAPKWEAILDIFKKHREAARRAARKEAGKEAAQAAEGGEG
ncbi:MAG: hypothetical protein NC489_37950 [Ruminococcus flavefaciens]|nr:hypothetical protein [Ruminococcus flavefaciens]